MSIKPPTDWLDDPEELGDAELWGPSGPLAQILDGTTVDKESMKPLFALAPWQGGDLILFQAGNPAVYYFFSPLDDSVRKIALFTDLQKIVDWINDEDKGYSSILTEPVQKNK